MWTARVTHRSHPGSDEPGAGPILAGPRSVDNSSQKERAQHTPYSSIFLVLTKGTTLVPESLYRSKMTAVAGRGSQCTMKLMRFSYRFTDFHFTRTV